MFASMKKIEQKPMVKKGNFEINSAFSNEGTSSTEEERIRRLQAARQQKQHYQNFCHSKVLSFLIAPASKGQESCPPEAGMFASMNKIEQKPIVKKNKVF